MNLFPYCGLGLYLLDNNLRRKVLSAAAVYLIFCLEL